MDPKKLVPLVQNPVFRDLAVVCALVLISAYLAAAFDFFELLFAFTRAHEEWELDDAVLVVLLSPIGIAWFAYRRWAAERWESAVRRQAEHHRDALQKQFSQVQRMETVARLTGKVARDLEAINRSLNEELHLAIRNMDNRAALQRSLVTATDAVDRAADLAKQLVTFGGKKILEQYEVSVGALVAGVQSRLMSVLDPNYTVAYVVKSDEAEIRTDGSEFCQAIVNLITNACEAMPTGGTITVTARTADDRVEFSVKDTGRGMEQETASRAFEPFFTTKKRGTGHGLGLTVVYGFVLASGGHIDLSSAPGRGTTVRLSFPLAGQSAGHKSPRSAAAVA